MNSKDFGLYSTEEIAIGGYLQCLPPIAAPTVPEYKTSLPIFAP